MMSSEEGERGPVGYQHNSKILGVLSDERFLPNKGSFKITSRASSESDSYIIGDKLYTWAGDDNDEGRERGVNVNWFHNLGAVEGKPGWVFRTINDKEWLSEEKEKFNKTNEDKK